MKALHVVMAQSSEGDSFPIAAFDDEKDAEQFSSSIKNVVGGCGIVDVPYIKVKDELTVNYMAKGGV